MAEPTIICPKCRSEVKLTESLAAPLIETTRREYEQRLAQKDADLAGREKSLHEREDQLAKAKETVATQVAETLRQERAKIAGDEARKAKLALAGDLQQKAKEVADLQEILKEREVKLAEAQRAQADFLRQQRELEDARRELELTVERRIQAGLTTTRQQAKQEAEAELKQKVMEKEQTINSMQIEIEALKRKAEQGSQQLQGEVQELELEALLRAKFPRDVNSTATRYIVNDQRQTQTKTSAQQQLSTRSPCFKALGLFDNPARYTPAAPGVHKVNEIRDARARRAREGPKFVMERS